MAASICYFSNKFKEFFDEQTHLQIFILFCAGVYYGLFRILWRTGELFWKSPSGPVPVTGEHLYGVASYDTNNVFVVGFESTVFHTSNAGTDWEKQQIPLMTDLYDVSFVDQNNGWISGKGGDDFAHR